MVLRRSHRYFFIHLKGKIEGQDFIQSTVDPCLFIRKHMIYLVYVDDCFFFAFDDSQFDKLQQKICEVNLILDRKKSLGFLGVKLTVN